MINDIILTNLKTINIEKDTLRHVIKKNELTKNKFGEIYTSSISYNKTRAWKKQTKITMNLVVLYGKVKVVMYDNRKKSPTFNMKHVELLSQNPYFRLTIPPGIWYGFKDCQKNRALSWQ